ncbi:MAG TPA: cytochrome c [Terricaulis sp.]|nr:cytochrome c [Terricaulis sp.]HRP11442.1 cytochrome c [Terricaulis sp.]
MLRFSFVMLALALGACAAPPTQMQEPTQAALARDGRDIAEAQCAACHSVGDYGESPLADAPAFRTLLSRYRADVLEDELIAGIQVTHRMPDFQFNPQGADALIAYLRSIQEEPAR